MSEPTTPQPPEPDDALMDTLTEGAGPWRPIAIEAEAVNAVLDRLAAEVEQLERWHGAAYTTSFINRGTTSAPVVLVSLPAVLAAIDAARPKP